MAIQANELRIGNWVEHIFNGHKWKITLSDFVEEYEMGQAFFHMKPILLTEEILRVAGFEGSVWFRKSLGLNLVGDTGVFDLVLGKTGSPNGLPYCPAIEQGSNDGFTIQEAADIQSEEKLKGNISEDEAFFLKAKRTVVLYPINYLHQLQNLYFSLTGEELQISL